MAVTRPKLPRLIDSKVGVVSDAYHHLQICGPGDKLTENFWNTYYRDHTRAQFLDMLKRCISSRLRGFDEAAEFRMRYLKDVINSRTQVDLDDPPFVILHGVEYDLQPLVPRSAAGSAGAGAGARGKVAEDEEGSYMSDLDHLQFVYLLRRLYLLVRYAVQDGQDCTFVLTEIPGGKDIVLRKLQEYKETPGIDIVGWQWSMHRTLSNYYNRRFVTIRRPGFADLSTKFDIYERDNDDVVGQIATHIVDSCEKAYTEPEMVYTGPFGVLNSALVRELNYTPHSSTHTEAYFWSSFMSLRFGMFSNITWADMMGQFDKSGLPESRKADPCLTLAINETTANLHLPAYVSSSPVQQIRDRACNYIIVKILQKLLHELECVKRFVTIIKDLFQKAIDGQLAVPLLPIDQLSQRHTYSASDTRSTLAKLISPDMSYLLNARYEFFTGLPPDPDKPGSVGIPSTYKSTFKQALMEHFNLVQFSRPGEKQEFLTKGTRPNKDGRPLQIEFEAAFIDLINGNGNTLSSMCNSSDIMTSYTNEVVDKLREIYTIQDETIVLAGHHSLLNKYNYTKQDVFIGDLRYKPWLWIDITDKTTGVVTRKNNIHSATRLQITERDVKVTFKQAFGIVLNSAEPDGCAWIPYDGYTVT